MKQKAFTLIELLVVIVIIGILATISTATFSGAIDKANDAKRLTFMQSIYDEAKRSSLTPDFGPLLGFVMLQLDGKSSFPQRVDKSIREIVQEYFYDDVVSNDTCVLVASAVTDDSENSQLLFLSWANGSNELQLVGSEDWKNDIAGNAWTKQDFVCDYDTATDSWEALTDTIVPKLYPFGVTTYTEFCQYARPGTLVSACDNAIQRHVQMIRPDGRVCSFYENITFPISLTEAFGQCEFLG